MFKTLLKKQFMEAMSTFSKGKNKQKQVKGNKSFSIILFCVLLSFFALLFFGFGFLLCESLVAVNLRWFYFLIASVISLFLGVFASVFNTYATLYLAKDNDLLLSMPIKPKMILSVRILTVYLLGAIYASIAYIPMLLAYYVFGSPSLPSIILSFLLLFILTLLILALSCGLGYIVAIISSRLKNKSFITVIISVAFIGVFYIIYFKAVNSLDVFLENATLYGEKIKNGAYVLYLIGSIGEGNFLAFLVVLAITTAIFLLTYFIMSATFLKMTTIKTGVNNKKVGVLVKRQYSVNATLLIKELKRFLASPAYMLNAGLGTLLLPVLAIFIFIKGSDLFGELAKLFSIDVIAMIAIVAICFTSTINDITAPSVSLEGKSIWIAKTLPVKTKSILKAKINLHVILTAIPVLLCSISLIVALKLNFIYSIAVIIIPILYVVFNAYWGLISNLLTPNLEWVNETVAVKQGASVFIGLFGSWLIVILLSAIVVALQFIIHPLLCLGIIGLLLSMSIYLFDLWISNKGVKIFENL